MVHHVAQTRPECPDDSSEGLASRILSGFPAIHHLDAAHACQRSHGARMLYVAISRISCPAASLYRASYCLMHNMLSTWQTLFSVWTLTHVAQTTSRHITHSRISVVRNDCTMASRMLGLYPAVTVLSLTAATASWRQLRTQTRLCGSFITSGKAPVQTRAQKAPMFHRRQQLAKRQSLGHLKHLHSQQQQDECTHHHADHADRSLHSNITGLEYLFWCAVCWQRPLWAFVHFLQPGLMAEAVLLHQHRLYVMPWDHSKRIHALSQSVHSFAAPMQFDPPVDLA